MLEAKTLATVRSYQQLLAVLRARADELEITREITDDATGLPAGYSSKLLSATPIKNLGPMSFGAVLGVLGLALIVVEDTRPILPKAKRRRGREVADAKA